MTAADKELTALLGQTGTSLLTLKGIGPSGAARLLVEDADITRFPSRAHFASWTAPPHRRASSGDQIRHRLSRAGNRQINRALHIMATVQLRNRTPAGRPVRTLGGGYELQRGRLEPRHRRFGEVSPRIRHRPASNPMANCLLTEGCHESAF